jgi:hypothetical protein
MAHGRQVHMQHMSRTLPRMGPQFKQNSLQNVKQTGPVSVEVAAV